MMCVFCAIVAGAADAHRVLEAEDVVAFLDTSPFFAGHVLVCPRDHHETLVDLPPSLLAPVLGTAQRVAAAIERGLGADGSFIAINNRISQSVPHLHVHVIPRRRGDGMKHFFWPRTKVEPAEMVEIAAKIRAALASDGRA